VADYPAEELGPRRQSVDATDAVARGRALEELVYFLFSSIPGLTLSERNQVNDAGSEEIDIAFWNDRRSDGPPLDSRVVLIECKNWSRPLGSQDVGWFDRKLQQRALPEGVLVAASGITGSAEDLTAANRIISEALRDGRRIIVITLGEIDDITSSEGLIELMKVKLLRLTIRQTSI
jgi:hypothetical protein